MASLNVSLEPHLLELLSPLLPALPTPISSNLDLSQNTIPHASLNEICTWANTSAGKASLESHNLAVSSYASMIVLLAGCTTSPERHFPKYTPKEDEADRERKRQVRERTAITALANAVLSIIGTAAAVWWAAGRLPWRDEWRVLLALLAAFVVAIAEGVLFLIWQSKKDATALKRKQRRAGAHKKDLDEMDEIEPKPLLEDRELEGLRQRGK